MPEQISPQKGQDQVVFTSTGPASLRRRVNEAEGHQVLKFWYQRWLVRFVTVVSMILFAVGATGFYFYRAHRDREAAMAKLVTATTDEVQALLADRKVAEAVVALEAAALKGLRQDVLVSLDRHVKTTLAEQSAAEIKDSIAKRKPYLALLVLQKAVLQGLPSAMEVELHKQIIDSLATQTAEEVREAIGKHQYRDAELVLEKARRHGLPNEITVDTEREINACARTYRNELLSQADDATATKEFARARELLSQADSLAKYAAGSEVSEAEKKLDDHQQRDRDLEAKQRLMESRNAAQRKQWDVAIQALDGAQRTSPRNPELAKWETELRKLVQGRLRVLGSPPGSRVKIRDKEEAPIGEVIVGLTGRVEFVVSAPGYVPEVLAAVVDYPKITEVQVDLTPAAPSTAWVISLLADHPSQWLVLEHYRHRARNRAKNESGCDLASFTTVTKPTTENAESVEKAELTKLTEAAVQKLRKREDGLIKNLDKLAMFAARTPGALDAMFRDKQYPKAMGECLARLENACAACKGEGKLACPECKGIGKRKEQGVCLACDGKGSKICFTCKGTQMMPCGRCGGSGKVTQERKHGIFQQDVDVACPTCGGRGSVHCTKCRGGQLKCSKCKGTGQSDERRPCSACDGQGGHRCEVCGGTGSRDQMDPVSRRPIEQTLLELCGEKPTKR